MGIGNRHRQRIGGIGTFDNRTWQQHLEHRLNLRLFRRAGAEIGLGENPLPLVGIETDQ